MDIANDLAAAITRHAEKSPDAEICGLVVKRFSDGKTVYCPCANVAHRPSEEFEIAADDWLAAEESGGILAVVHSHLDDAPPFLSGADRQFQTATGLPWLLFARGRLKTFRCCAHLRGREFAYGTADCAALVRDALMLGGLDLPDQARGSMDGDRESGALPRYLAANGFERVSELQAGDVLLFDADGLPSHLGLYLGGGEMLHHAVGQLSRREPYSRFRQGYTHSVWRYKDWQPEMMTGINNDLIWAVER